MNKLDMRITRELMRGNVRDMMLLNADELRKSFRSIGRSLHVDQGTVRNRIKKLKEVGLIRGWHIRVNPALYGRKLGCLMVDANPNYDKREIIDKISSINDVSLICNYMGPHLQILISGESDESLTKTCKMIGAITGQEGAWWIQRPTATINFTLSRGDWEIIKILRHDPWKSYEQIARETHLSSKTTRKKIAKLVEEGAIQFSVDVDLSALQGFVPSALIVTYVTGSERSRAIRRITEYLGDDLFFAALDDQQVGLFALNVPNVARLEQIGNWAKRQPDLTGCRTLVLLDIILTNTGVKKEMEQIVIES